MFAGILLAVVQSGLSLHAACLKLASLALLDRGNMISFVPLSPTGVILLSICALGSAVYDLSILSWHCC